MAAARRLGKELARIQTGEDEPAPERVREAIREVVAHCIYGVDKNPLAVELCRVALWLEAHCEGKPLTFLDHRIRCGDSLVGVIDLQVLSAGIPDAAFQPAGEDDRAVARALRRRNQEEGQYRQRCLPFDAGAELQTWAEVSRQLELVPDDTPEHIREKARLLAQRERQTERQRTAGNLWTAAFFQRLARENPGPAASVTTGTLRQFLETSSAPGPALGQAESLAHRQRFFHWPLEFPEVCAAGGFDVVLGNPPFMGGLRISGTLGDRYRHWLEFAFRPYGGTADLCAAFYRRAFDLLKPGGRLGLVATNTIGQGDTRESGLAVILQQGGVITLARRFLRWPGAANVEVNLVGLCKADPGASAPPAGLLLDGQEVPFISSRLDPEPEAEPYRLPLNDNKAFQGDIVRGLGFVLEPAEAEPLLVRDPKNAQCLFPYLNGEDLNSHTQQQPSRWVICFHDWDLDQAAAYPDLLRLVEERVKPERERLRGPGDRRNRAYWWQFGAYRSGLRQTIAPLRRVLVRSRVSELHALVFVKKGYIYADVTVVFAFDDDYHFALLQSSVHEVWLRKQASSLRTDVRYTPTDCFATFPFPPEEYRLQSEGEWYPEALPEPFATAARRGAAYHEHRRQVMLARGLGLTKTYNLFHDPACLDPDIARLRELHAALDLAVLACYGWEDLDPEHGFYQNERGQTRFTVAPTARREMLRRLLELNLRLGANQVHKSAPTATTPVRSKKA